MRNYEYWSDEVLRHEDMDDTRRERQELDEEAQAIRDEIAYEMWMMREPIPF